MRQTIWKAEKRIERRHTAGEPLVYGVQLDVIDRTRGEFGVYNQHEGMFHTIERRQLQELRDALDRWLEE